LHYLFANLCFGQNGWPFKRGVNFGEEEIRKSFFFLFKDLLWFRAGGAGEIGKVCVDVCV
jgi:hypothetical protein